MQTITDDLKDLLRSRFQAAARGFRGRIEIDWTNPAVPSGATPAIVQSVASGDNTQGGVTNVPLPAAVTPGNVLVYLCGKSKIGNAQPPYNGTVIESIGGPGAWTQLGTFVTAIKSGSTDQWSLGAWAKVADGTEPMSRNLQGGEGFCGIWELSGYTIAGPTVAEDDGTGTSVDVGSLGSPAAGLVALMIAAQFPGDVGAVTWDPLDFTTDLDYGSAFFGNTRPWWIGHQATGGGAVEAAVGSTDTSPWAGIAVVLAPSDASIPATSETAAFRAISIGIDKSQRMTADQADIVIANELGYAGVSLDSIIQPNAPIRIYQWLGDDANEVQTFAGLIDAVHEHRDVRRTTITARDCMKRLIDQTIAVPSPQGADESGAVRTTANYVYLNAEVSDIVEDLLNKAGWPAGLRDIFPTGYAVEEFLGTDGASYADTIIGQDRLTGLVGYEAGAREDGYFYFRPALQTTAADADTAAEPVYSYIVADAGSDPLTSAMVTELDHELDDYDLRTRVKVRGPLTTLKAAWTEVWHTNRYTKPVGLWHDPADSGFLKVLDRGTRKIYRLRQSDRTNVGTGIWPLDISGDVTYPLGLSGDPADSDRFWVLEAAWRATGSVSLAASIHKYDASSGAHLAEYALPDGQWTDIKVSASFIWLTNFSTDKVHKYNKATGASIASYTTTYSTAQVNPSGVFVDGTTLGLFFYGKARFLLVDEADPTTIDATNAIGVGSGVISTAGTKILGGELDTVTDIDLYACSDDLGLVWKFTLANPVDETVWVEVVDTDLEDELGFLGGSADREHDTHPGAADHPFEVRRETIDVQVVTSLAQATETATRWLNLLAHRREVLDLGVVGNPALQKGDLVHVEDPVTGVDADYVIDTYRTAMEDDTYLGTLALLPANPVY